MSLRSNCNQAWQRFLVNVRNYYSSQTGEEWGYMEARVFTAKFSDNLLSMYISMFLYCSIYAKYISIASVHNFLKKKNQVSYINKLFLLLFSFFLVQETFGVEYFYIPFLVIPYIIEEWSNSLNDLCNC